MTPQTMTPTPHLPGSRAPTNEQRPVERPSTAPTSTGLVSIIVPCTGQLEMTRLSAPRLLQHSRSPFQVVFVDVGSLDGTREYLAGVAACASGRMEVLRTDADLDLLSACQEGIAHSHGDFIVLLSNDTLVSEGWLGHLTALVKLAPNIGMVGAMSNLAPPPQWVGPLPYRINSKQAAKDRNGMPIQEGTLDLDPVDHFAAEWRDKHRGKSCEVQRLGGSCLLLKTEVLKKIDLSGLQTSFGAIDGDLLSQRVRQAGNRLALCEDLFLHHFGSRLFAALRVDTASPPSPTMPGSPAKPD